jgi:hypothetical protein
MVRIFQCFTELVISRYTANIFRRAGPGAVQAFKGRLKFRVEIAAVLENDLMLPAVAEILQIVEGAPFLLDQIPKTVSPAFKPVFF